MTARQNDGAKEQLVELFDVSNGVEDGGVRSLPDQGVAKDDGGRKSRRAPVGREIDDRWRKAVGKEHVPRQIAVDELAWLIDGTQCSHELIKMLDLVEL